MVDSRQKLAIRLLCAGGVGEKYASNFIDRNIARADNIDLSRSYGDGDGKTDPAVYRDGTWYLLQSLNGWAEFQWGISTDIPVPADYDGDGRTDAAVFRDGPWWLRQSASGVSVHQFGMADDKPVPAAFVN